MTDELLTEFTGSRAVATFNRPSARNAMTWAMYDGLVDFCERVDADENVRVAVLRGAGGKAFVAGTDIAQFSEFRGARDGLAYERRIESVLARLERVRVPVIAAIEGYATGGGLAIAAACDLRVCTEDAKFGIPIARTVGNCLSMATYARLVHLVGAGRASTLLLTAGFTGAREALGCGLVSEVVEPDRLTGRVGELADQLAGQAPLTMLASKTAIRRLREHDLPDGDDLVEMCYGSADFAEGVAAFVGKRAPRWRGR
ncbi:enoyl-CoA hydratase [Prauserella marina]|uniref:Enoyl-CoA hydratase/carnithine racemase n=1 Tax=Prauserella marina TaxID=530584 RepID=A0A222VS07_9PSEU|nr:enoyl-CoA hydratase/isomerase family protein [Prauserella marina]ASR36523.1 enoyl-CoA hydratase [Prauserella marina]PWV73913.1 enoyl-CoA hydratase/carnithine racemase [Prauserella marina]SDD58796.1 Enoyl-CoA hydratase/carnithine racemase [Prauserella marina]